MSLKRFGMAAILACLATMVVAVTPVGAVTNPWVLRSIDDMHASRDFMCFQQSTTTINAIAAADKAAHANYATVDTPYDPSTNYFQGCTVADPVAYEQRWVDALRAQGLEVWFRQTWFNWEGSYGAPKLTSATTPAVQLGTAANVLNGTDTTSYLAKTYHFILNHPSFFRNGDLFTPEAEPQNGGIRDSFGQCSGPCQFTGWPQLNIWLRDAMTVDTQAFQQLGLQVSVGWWGLPCSNNKWNGANNIEPSTITQMVFYVSDCYFPDPTTELAQLQIVRDAYGALVIVGEWGNIWDTTQPATANRISSMMSAIAGLSWVNGFNYWQSYGGTGNEGLVDKTTLALNQNGQVVASRFAAQTS